MFKLRKIQFLVCGMICIAFHYSMLSESKFIFMRAVQIWISALDFCFFWQFSIQLFFNAFHCPLLSCSLRLGIGFKANSQTMLLSFCTIYVSASTSNYLHYFPSINRNWIIEILLTILVTIYEKAILRFESSNKQKRYG